MLAAKRNKNIILQFSPNSFFLTVMEKVQQEIQKLKELLQYGFILEEEFQRRVFALGEPKTPIALNKSKSIEDSIAVPPTSTNKKRNSYFKNTLIRATVREISHAGCIVVSINQDVPRLKAKRGEGRAFHIFSNFRTQSKSAPNRGLKDTQII